MNSKKYYLIIINHLIIDNHCRFLVFMPNWVINFKKSNYNLQEKLIDYILLNQEHIILKKQKIPLINNK